MKKLVYGLLLLLVIGIVGTLVTVNLSGGFSLDTYNVSDKKVVSGSNFDSIEIDLSSTDVKVVPTDDKDITIELDGKVSKKLKKKLSLDVNERGKTLKVTLKGEDQIIFNIGVLIVDTNVNVYLPKKVYDTIKVETSSGSNEIEGLHAKRILLKSSSNDIVAENCKAEDSFQLNTSSGEIQANNNEAREFQFKASSGDLIAKDQKGEIGTFQTSSGDIELKNISGNIDAGASSGSITIDNKEETGDITAKTSSGEVIVNFDKNPTSLAIDFKGSSGSGTIHIKGFDYEEKSDNRIIGKIGSGQYKLKVNTSSGDFELN